MLIRLRVQTCFPPRKIVYLIILCQYILFEFFFAFSLPLCRCSFFFTSVRFYLLLLLKNFFACYFLFFFPSVRLDLVVMFIHCFKCNMEKKNDKHIEQFTLAIIAFSVCLHTFHPYSFRFLFLSSSYFSAFAMFTHYVFYLLCCFFLCLHLSSSHAKSHRID